MSNENPADGSGSSWKGVGGLQRQESGSGLGWDGMGWVDAEMQRRIGEDDRGVM